MIVVEEVPSGSTGVCPKCGRKMSEKTFDVGGVTVRGWHCDYCGKDVIHPEDAEGLTRADLP